MKILKTGRRMCYDFDSIESSLVLPSSSTLAQNKSTKSWPLASTPKYWCCAHIHDHVIFFYYLFIFIFYFFLFWGTCWSIRWRHQQIIRQWLQIYRNGSFNPSVTFGENLRSIGRQMRHQGPLIYVRGWSNIHF